MARYQVGLHLRAAAEIDQIAKWWRKNRPAAPRLFLDELDRAFLAISEHPEIGRKVGLRAYPNARTYVLRRTRYIVIYNVDTAAGVIAVARVRHGKRRPLTR
jgi:plasmid stabilization system protein ParE